MASFGSIIGNLGTQFKLPEFGISELLDGQQTKTPTVAGIVANGVQKNTQTQAPASNTQNLTSGNSGQYSGSYSSGGGSVAVDPAVAAYNAQANQYQDAYNALDGQLQAGIGNLQNGYNSNLNTLNDNNAVATRNYNTSVGQNTQNFLSTKNNINTTTRNNANSLQRLLGLNGAGNSSAATEAAPYAAALQGSQNLNGAQTTYANNQANLDTSFGDTKRAYEQKLKDLDQSLFAGKQGLQSQIAQQRVNLLNQITGAKTLAGDTSGNNQRSQQVKDLLASLTGLSNNYASPVQVDTNLNYTAPTAQDYSLGSQAVASNGQSGAASDIANPFLSLLTQKRDQYGQPIYG